MVADELPYYYLSLRVLDSRTTTTVNGFWVDSSDGAGSASFDSPINHILVGQSNRINVKVRPTEIEDEESGYLRPSVPSEAVVEVSVKRVVGGFVTPEAGEVLATTTLDEVIEERKRELEEQFNDKLQNVSPSERKSLVDKQEELTTVKFPLEIELTFDSEDVPFFRERFLEAPTIDDTTLIKDYALKLRNLLRRQNLDALYEEFEPKFEEYDKAFPSHAEPDNRAWFKDLIQEAFYSRVPLLDFKRDDLNLKRWCGGRIWELEVDRSPELKNSLLYARGEEESFFVDTFVGIEDGTLKVVR
jgi:hypothetical protein